VEDSGKKKVLIVDDELIITMIVKMIPERNSFLALVAKTGTEAVHLASTDMGIDLVLMDIKLGPDMDGAEFTRAILSKRDLPIVFQSSHT